MSRVIQHNREVVFSAQSRASEMEMWPSPLEKKMKEILMGWGIRFETQYIFYIYAKDNWIIRYYIADFYIPSKKIIIEVDGKFHDKHKQHDKQRTKDIQQQYPGIQVLRYQWKDLSNRGKMAELLSKIE